jgi:hypothetical protein
MFRYHLINVDANDQATTIQIVKCENDSVAWRLADNLFSLGRHRVEVWRDGLLVHRVGRPL